MTLDNDMVIDLIQITEGIKVTEENIAYLTVDGGHRYLFNTTEPISLSFNIRDKYNTTVSSCELRITQQFFKKALLSIIDQLINNVKTAHDLNVDELQEFLNKHT